jgi:plastocyanin/uncharacterized membrane protein
LHLAVNWVFDDLPLHPLIVHAPVVLIPLVAAGLLVFVFRPDTRRILGPILTTIAVAAAFSAVLAVVSGERLAEDLGREATASTHAARGKLTRLLAIVVAAATLGLVAIDRYRPGLRVATSRVPGLLVSWVAIGAMIVVGLTGHSGAKLAWEGKLPNPTGDSGGPVVAESDPPTASTQPVPTESAGGAATASPGEAVVDIVLGEWTLISSVDEIPPGTTTFRVHNAGTHVHAFRIRTPGSGGDRSEWRSEPVGPGDTVTFTADLPEGTLELTCPIEDGAGDHDDLGMQAALTVRVGAPPPVPSTPTTTAAESGSTPRSSAATSVTLDISAFAYNPDDVTVPLGANVTWTNYDPAPHTATGDSFDSGTLSTGDTASVTFTSLGEYAYFCSIHPSMIGRILVAD